MCLTEYNEAETMELFKEEGREEGREEGKDAAVIENLRTLMSNFKWSAQQAMDALSIPNDKRTAYMGLVTKN